LADGMLINLSQDRAECQTLVLAVLNPRVLLPCQSVSILVC